MSYLLWDGRGFSGFYDKDGGGVVGRRRGTPPREYGLEAERALLFQDGDCRKGAKNQSVIPHSHYTAELC